MQSHFLFLGTGASTGVPRIGCHCEVCASDDPRNKRLRPGGLLKLGDKRILIDAGPDFRTQALTHRIDHLDGFILTHSHFDHIAGVDDLRIYFFLQGVALPTLCSTETYAEFKSAYSYFFAPDQDPFSKSQKFAFQLVTQPVESATFCGCPIKTVSYSQAGMRVIGIKVGDLAYVSDIKEYDEALCLEALRGTKTLIISALRHKPSDVHFSLDDAIAFSRKLGAQRTLFTHISHDLDHEKTNRELPTGFELAYDGLEIPFTLEAHG